MVWDKLHKISVVTLGAINGILLGILSEIVLRSAFLLEVFLRSREPLSPEISIDFLPYPFSWWYLPLLSLTSVTLATFIVHRFLIVYIKSSVWFWQMVGIVTIFICAIYSTIFFFYNWSISNFEFVELDSVVSALRGDLFILFVMFLIGAAYNLLFAFVLKRIKSHLP